MGDRRTQRVGIPNAMALEVEAQAKRLHCTASWVVRCAIELARKKMFARASGEPFAMPSERVYRTYYINEYLLAELQDTAARLEWSRGMLLWFLWNTARDAVGELRSCREFETIVEGLYEFDDSDKREQILQAATEGRPALSALLLGE